MKGQLGKHLMALAVGLLALVSVAPTRAQDVIGTTGIRGAGSTFAFPILSKWSREYRLWLARGGDFPAANSGLEDPPATSAIDYEAVGSLAGTLRVQNGAVDFGASDVPLKTEELSKSGLAQFPLVIGGVVAVVNIDGIGPGELRFTGPLLADVFLGKIVNWSDPAIKALNPTLELPDAPITVVRRADGSGTTFNFTDYLSKASPQWKEKVGSDLTVSWPVGSPAKGNDGVSQTVRRIKNSIGYVEYTHALQTKLSFALLQNRAGNFITPGPSSFQAAAASADWAKTSDFHLLLTDVPAPDAYPIVATVFVLMHKTRSPNARTRAALDFFRWSFEKGARDAAQLGYVPLPDPLVTQIRQYWSKNFSVSI